jgi:hypothetical protein
MKKVPPGPYPGQAYPIRCSNSFFGRTFSLQDFIPFFHIADAVKLLSPCLGGTGFRTACDVGQISAKMALSQPIAYDETFIHKKTKVIRLE